MSIQDLNKISDGWRWTLYRCVDSGMRIIDYKLGKVAVRAVFAKCDLHEGAG